MFRIPLPALAALLVLCAPALAQDAAKGEAEFRKCKACHAIEAPDGTAIQKGGKTGPNLYGVVGRTVASTDFAYGDSLKSVGAAGTKWDDAALVAYVANPTAWLKKATGKRRCRCGGVSGLGRPCVRMTPVKTARSQEKTRITPKSAIAEARRPL